MRYRATRTFRKRPVPLWRLARQRTGLAQEVIGLMQPAAPPLLELANRLRWLRVELWPDKRLTQALLAGALSAEGSNIAPATVSSWESPTSPKLPPRDRLSAYARFFATRRSVEVEGLYRLVPRAELTEGEQAAFKDLESELLALHDAVRRPSPSVVTVARRSWHFSDPGPTTLVCAQIPEGERHPMASPADPNYTELLSYADLDALMELRGHIRAENPSMDVFHKAATNVEPDDLTGHMILLGGIAWNEITKQVTDIIDIPVRQVHDPSLSTGEIFIANVGGKDQKFFPTWGSDDHESLVEDVGLLARMPNPLNSSRTLTMCNGIHSRGVLGAVRSLTDARLRETNEGYISAHISAESFAILMRVRVIDRKTMTPDFTIPGTVLYQWSQDTGK
jgi:hypothetical protein